MLRNRQLARLRENRQKCIEYKKKIAKAVELLNLQLASSQISRQDYDKKLAATLESKSIEYWNNYYDNLIIKYESEISKIRNLQFSSILIAILLGISAFALFNTPIFTGQVVYELYPGASQHGYINRGGSCTYSPTGLLSDTVPDDSIYFSQGPFNGANTVFNWVSSNDIVYIDLGPINSVRSSLTEINITWNGRFSKTGGTGKPPTDFAIAWYDWNAGTWQQFDQGPLSQAEKSSFLYINNPATIANIVSSETNGYVRLGFQSIGTTTLCNALVLTDYTGLSVEVTPSSTSTSSSSTTVLTTSTSTSTSTTIIGTTTSSTTSSTSTTTSLSTSTSTTTTGTSTTSTIQPAQVIVNVAASVGITVDAVYSTADFSTLVVNSIDDTLDNNPLPILIRNEGSVLADVQISATDLWTSPNKQSSDYRFSIDSPDPTALVLTETGQPADSCSPLACFNAFDTILLPANMPITPALPANAINDLEFNDANDEAEINIFIHVPNDEPAGLKSSTLTITGVDASTF